GPVVQPAAGRPDQGLDGEPAQQWQAADVVEVEVGEHDVDAVDALQQGRIVPQPAQAAAGVEQQPPIAGADEQTCRLARARRDAAAAAEDGGLQLDDAAQAGQLDAPP